MGETILLDNRESTPPSEYLSALDLQCLLLHCSPNIVGWGKRMIQGKSKEKKKKKKKACTNHQIKPQEIWLYCLCQSQNYLPVVKIEKCLDLSQQGRKRAWECAHFTGLSHQHEREMVLVVLLQKEATSGLHPRGKSWPGGTQSRWVCRASPADTSDTKWFSAVLQCLLQTFLHHCHETTSAGLLEGCSPEQE